MQPNFADDIPKTDWSKIPVYDHYPHHKITSLETPESCCDGGRCHAAVQKPATSAQVEEVSIEHCEEVAARLVDAQREWNALRKKPHDAVKQPAHYTYSQVEPIVAIDAWQLSYNLGCVVKYIVRAKHKGNELLDLEKAAEYLRREIEFRTARLIAEEPRR